MTESCEQQVAAALAAIPHDRTCAFWYGVINPCDCDREARQAQAVAAAIAAVANYYSDTPQHKQDRALRALRGERP